MQLNPPRQRPLAVGLGGSSSLLIYLCLTSCWLGLARAASLTPEFCAPSADTGQVSTYYESVFHIVGRTIAGRQSPNVPTLENNQPRALNLQPGATACYVIRQNAIFERDDGNSDSTVYSADKGDTGSSGADSGPARLAQLLSRTIYISANTCLQPRPVVSGGRRTAPPQLVLRASTSAENGCPVDDEGKEFDEGAVTFSLNATGSVYVGITAPNMTSGYQGLYNFEVAASFDTYFHQYRGGGAAQLLWIDSDSRSALLTTRNLTEDTNKIQKIMSMEPPYELFVNNRDSSSIDGVRHSLCGLHNTAQITANSQSNGMANSPVTTGLTLRGPGGFPKQQFYFVALNASSHYTGILVKKPTVGANERRAVNATDPGSIVFEATDFQTISGTNCRIITNLEFCDETQYAVPGNDNRFNNTALATAYDEYVRQMYSNFEKVMMQIACEAPDTSLYSLARNCNDCRAAYKRWLCTVSIPRCEDILSNSPFSVPRNAGQAFPNGSSLPDEVKNALVQFPYSKVSRNKFIDAEIQPGPYREILPCEDVCYEVVQSCPAAIGFTCPQPGLIGFNVSYGRRGQNGSTVWCNYPGEPRTPLSGASTLLPSEWMLIYILSLFLVLFLG